MNVGVAKAECPAFDKLKDQVESLRYWLLSLSKHGFRLHVHAAPYVVRNAFDG